MKTILELSTLDCMGIYFLGLFITALCVKIVAKVVPDSINENDTFALGVVCTFWPIALMLVIIYLVIEVVGCFTQRIFFN